MIITTLENAMWPDSLKEENNYARGDISEILLLLLRTLSGTKA